MASAKPAGYRLATYKSGDGPRAGLVIGEEVFDAAKLTGKPAYATVAGILADWKSAEGALRKAAAGAARSRAKRQPLKKTKLLAPIQSSVAIYCAGANYADHAAAMAAREGNPPPPDPHVQGLKPFHFLKAPGTIADPGATIGISSYAKAMDWEIELAAVIGRPAKDVSKEKALAYVAGYLAANDLAIQHGLAQAQDVRRFLPDRAMDRAGKRHCRPAKARPQTVGQRRVETGFKHRENAVHAGRTDRAFVGQHDALPRRPDPDGHTLGYRRRERDLPQSRGHRENLDRKHRRDRKPDGVAGMAEGRLMPVAPGFALC
jgi:hypothetical protein